MALRANRETASLTRHRCALWCSDEVLIRNMLSAPRLGAAGPAVAAELRAMAQRGRKAELEALYSADAESSLTDVLLPKILRQDYI